MIKTEEIINDFYYLLISEYDGINPLLSQEEYTVFRKYYHFLGKQRRYLYQDLYQRRLSYVTRLLLLNGGLSILDAGCGLGTESLFFSSLGAKVTAVDLNEPRLAVASKRKLFYGEFKGEIDFILANVFEIVKKYQFDIIWMNEAISHIHPAEEFLRLAYRQLKPKGRILISDGNGASPYIRLKHFIREGRLSWLEKSKFNSVFAKSYLIEGKVN